MGDFYELENTWPNLAFFLNFIINESNISMQFIY